MLPGARDFASTIVFGTGTPEAEIWCLQFRYSLCSALGHTLHTPNLEVGCTFRGRMGRAVPGAVIGLSFIVPARPALCQVMSLTGKAIHQTALPRKSPTSNGGLWTVWTLVLLGDAEIDIPFGHPPTPTVEQDVKVLGGVIGVGGREGVGRGKEWKGKRKRPQIVVDVTLVNA